MYWNKELFDIKWSQEISNFEEKHKLAIFLASLCFSS